MRILLWNTELCWAGCDRGGGEFHWDRTLWLLLLQSVEIKIKQKYIGYHYQNTQIEHVNISINIYIHTKLKSFIKNIKFVTLISTKATEYYHNRSIKVTAFCKMILHQGIMKKYIFHVRWELMTNEKNCIIIWCC